MSAAEAGQEEAAGRREEAAGRRLPPDPGHCPRDPLGLCCRCRRPPKLRELGRSRRVDIEDSMLDQFLGKSLEKPTSHL